MATLGKEESGCCGEVAIAERFKQESMHGLSAIKSGHCREVAIVESWLIFFKGSFWGVYVRREICV